MAHIGCNYSFVKEVAEMLPITGPVVRYINRDPSFCSHATRYKQVPPYDLPSAYTLSLAKRIRLDPGFPPNTYIASNVRTTGHPMLNEAKILAYDKLKDKIHDQASLGAGLAEARQSIGMINARAIQLYQFVRAVKRGRFGDAAEILRLPGPPKGVGKTKSAAQNFLEYNFGWAPLVGDIYSAVDVLGGQLKAPKVKARAGPVELVTKQTYPPPNFSYGHFHTYRTYVLYGCEVRISNKNVALYNQLGLINPLTVVWEIIPFSFVVDWFINVEQFLSTATDFLGLTIEKSYTTALTKTVRIDALRATASPVIVYEQFDIVNMSRTLGISQPTIGIRPFKVPGWRRAASAVSLLTLQLKSLR
jgi:hypothetical protein